MAYKYYNRNPNGYHLPDCVIRAISTAMDMDYDEVVELLMENGKLYGCDMLNICCYDRLLTYNFNLPNYYGDGRTAAELAEDYPNNILLLRMPQHLSCSIHGVIHDIWDCSNQIVTHYWIVD